MPDTVFKFGRRAPDQARKLLWLEDYLPAKGALPAPPPAGDYSLKVAGGFPMMLNDQLGDCVVAMKGHSVEVFTAYGDGATVTPTDNDILKGYEQDGGYRPGHPETDNGCVITDALDNWTKTPLAGKKISAYAGYNPKNQSSHQLAAWLFGNNLLGVSLPDNFMDGFDAGAWSDTAAPPNPQNGHAVLGVGYNTDGLWVITWGRKIKATWAWLARYCEEAYVALSPDWLKPTPPPPGIDLASLAQDWTALTGKPWVGPTPQPPQPPVPPVPPAPVGPSVIRQFVDHLFADLLSLSAVKNNLLLVLAITTLKTFADSWLASHGY